MRTHDVTDQPVAAPEPKAPSVLRPLAHAQILALQRTAGNQAVARHLARQPAQSVEPPQESSAPPKLAAINHEGQYIATGVDGCYAAMTRVAGRQGRGRGRRLGQSLLQHGRDRAPVARGPARPRAGERDGRGDEGRRGPVRRGLQAVPRRLRGARGQRRRRAADGERDDGEGRAGAARPQGLALRPRRPLRRAREAAARRRAAADQAPGGRRARADVRGRPDGVRARDPPRPVPHRPRRAREGRRGAQDLERGREGLRRAGPPRDRRPALAGDVHDRRRRGVQARRRQRRLA